MAEQGSSALVAVRERTDAVAELVRARRERLQAWEGERHLPYTVLAVVGIALLGLVVVPLSIPEPLPEPKPQDVLAERYLLAFSASGSPAVAQGLKPPTEDTVRSTYGVDGGAACTGTLKDAYDGLVTTTPAGGTSFDKAAFARMKVVHSVYCPERTVPFAKFVKRRAALNAQSARSRAT